MLVPDIELSNVSDEEFLIYRAKELQTASSNASKSWLITAQVLYPNNFCVQVSLLHLRIIVLGTVFLL